MTIEKARELLENKDKQGDNSDMEKINTLNVLFKDDNVFLKISPKVAFGILEFLGVEEERIMEEYLELISLEEYHKHRIFLIKGEEKEK